MTSVLIKNLKRFRLARSMTQEQAAAQLGVSVQSISRWECGTTLPDVTLLPAIARLYCIAIDDLYKDTSPAYDNYAQRLAAIFEATHSPEDYLRADMEFRRLLNHDDCTPEDLRLYGILHQNMMQLCADQAQAMFDRVISAGPARDPDAYWRTRRQQLSLMSQLGRADEALARQQARLADHDDDVNEWICLIAALEHAGQWQAAAARADEALVRFPHSALLHMLCGDLKEKLASYSEAFQHWNQALLLDPDCLDALYAIGLCHEKLGHIPEALAAWTRLADTLRSRGYAAEQALPLEHIRLCREKSAQ